MMHIGWNKRALVTATVLENVLFGKRNIREGMHVRIHSEDKNLRIM